MEKWIPAKSGKTFETINPANEEVLGLVAEGDKADVDEAVITARKAFETGKWPSTTFPRRFPGHGPMAEVSRARMDFPSYPVDIVLPSFNHADTAHDKLLTGHSWNPPTHRGLSAYLDAPRSVAKPMYSSLFWSADPVPPMTHIARFERTASPAEAPIYASVPPESLRDGDLESIFWTSHFASPSVTLRDMEA